MWPSLLQICKSGLPALAGPSIPTVRCGAAESTGENDLCYDASVETLYTVSGLIVFSQFVPRVLLSVQRFSIAHARSLESPIDPPATTHHAQTTAIEKIVSSRPTFSSRKSASGDVRSSRQQTHDHQGRGDDAVAYVNFETKPILQSCQRRCPCQCHVAYEGSTPRWLSRLLGAAFVKASGTPVFGRRTCNFPRCVSTSACNGSLRIQYTFPIWFLRLAVEATATWRDLNGINGTWTFRIPRFVPDDGIHNTFLSCLLFGDSADLLELMSRRCIRPCDIISQGHEEDCPVLLVSRYLVSTWMFC
jgi:hypothetical protein